MNTRFAHILSAALHPLLMPTLLFGILFYASPEAIRGLSQMNQTADIDFFGLSLSLKLGLLFLIFNLTFLIPSYFVYILWKFGSIKSMRMESLEDRRVPFILTTVLYTLASVFFIWKMPQLPEVGLLMIAITFCIGAITVISLYWQISAHSTGIGGIMGVLLGMSIKLGLPLMLYPLVLVILLAGLLTSARLYLNAHIPEQILVGLGLGFILCFGMILAFV